MNTLTLKLHQLGHLAIGLAYPHRRERVSERSYSRFAATAQTLMSAEEYITQRPLRDRSRARGTRAQGSGSPESLALMHSSGYAPAPRRVSPHHISRLFSAERPPRDELFNALLSEGV